MSIKFAARGISTQFRTPQELVETDGVTLKPTTGGEVLVSGASGVLVGTAYNATTGGCTVDSTPYADTAALNAAGLYVISDASSAYDCGTETSAGVGVISLIAPEIPITFPVGCIMDTESNTETIFSSDFVLVEDKMYKKGEKYSSIECVDIPYMFIQI